MKFETQQVHAGQDIDPITRARAVAIHQTTSYSFENSDAGADLFALRKFGNIYTRITNPTNDVFEKRMATLEGGLGALATASGSAAITYAILNILRSGQNIISVSAIYGGTHNLFAHTLPNFGIKTKFVDADDEANFEKAIDENTRAIFFESIGNPNGNIVDIEKVVEIAHRHKIPVIVDNTFATPYLFKPISFGADIVVHSATKFIGGHGTSIGGVIIDSGNFNWEESGLFPQLVEPDPSYKNISYTQTFSSLAYIIKARVTLLRDTGACLSPFNAFLFLQGLESLSLRVERHNENAIKVIDYLKQSKFVEKINHPYLSESKYNKLAKKYFTSYYGSIFTIELKAGIEKTKQFVDSLTLFSNLANVADAKSLVIHPASTTHSQMNEQALLKCGIKENTVRLSIGIEHSEDIIADLEQSFKKVFI